MKKFSEINNVSEAWSWDWLKGGSKDKKSKGDSNGGSTVLDLFFNQIHRKFKEAKEESLSPEEKRVYDWQKKFDAQYEEEINNQLKHEQELEAELDNLAKEKELSELSAKEKARQAERKRELDAIKFTRKQIESKRNKMKNWILGPTTQQDAMDMLNEINKIAEGVIPAEKELLSNVKGAFISIYYDDDGNFIGNDQEKVNANLNNMPEDVRKAIINSEEYKKAIKNPPQTEDDLKKTANFLNKNVRSKADIENEQQLISSFAQTETELKSKIADLQSEKKSYTAAIEKTQKELASMKEPVHSGYDEFLNSLSEEQRNELIKNAGNAEKLEISDSQIVSIANKRLSQLTSQLKSESDEKQREKILAEIKSLGIDDATIEKDEATGEYLIKSDKHSSIEINSDNISDSFKSGCKSGIKSYLDSKSTYKEEKSKKEKSIEENKKKQEQIDKDIETTNTERKENLNNCDKVLEENGLPKLDRDNTDPLNNRNKSLAKEYDTADKNDTVYAAQVKKSKKNTAKAAVDEKIKKFETEFTDDEKAKIENIKNSNVNDIQWEKDENGDEFVELEVVVEDPQSQKVGRYMKKFKKKDLEDNQELRNMFTTAVYYKVTQEDIGERPQFDENATEEEQRKQAFAIRCYDEKKITQNAAKKHLQDTLGLSEDQIKNPNDNIEEFDNLDDFEGDAENEEDEDKELSGEDDEITDDDGTVLKNPTKEWHRRKKKNGQGTTKNYYNINGASISPKEYQERRRNYKEKLAKRKQKQQGGTGENHQYLLKPLSKYIFEMLDR